MSHYHLEQDKIEWFWQNNLASVHMGPVSGVLSIHVTQLY